MAAIALALGVALGWAYFTALRWNTRLYLERAPLWQSVGLQLLRVAVVAAAMLAAARAGALPLLCALAGLLLARQWVLRSRGAQ